MGLLAGLGAGVIATACGGGSSSKSASSSTTTRTTSAGASGTTAATAACVLTPEVTEGPYYLDLNKVRSDITEGKDGAPLDLKLTVVDATGCTPIKDAAIDVWHCDAGGIYSGFSQASAGGPGGGPGASQSATDSQTFLRGTQVTDAGIASLHRLAATPRAVEESLRAAHACLTIAIDAELPVLTATQIQYNLQHG